MKLNLLSISISLALLSSTSVIYAEICNFPYSEPADGEVASVGVGLDTDRQRYKMQSAVKGNKISVGGGIANLSAGLVDTYEEIYQQTSLKQDGKFGIGPFKLGASRELTSEITRKAYNANFMLRFNAVLPNEEWQPDTSGGTPLTDYAKSLLNDPCKFKQIFGDSFIYQTQRGVSVYVAVNVSFSSQEHLDEYTRGMNASVEGTFKGFTKTISSVCGAAAKTFKIPSFDFSGSFNQSKTNISKSTLKDGKISLAAMQVGGEATRLGQILGNATNGVSLASCSLDALDNCNKAFNNILAYLTTEEFVVGVREHPEVLNYLNRSYFELDPSITLVNEVTPEIENSREQLSQALLQRQGSLSTLEELLTLSLSPNRRNQLTLLKNILTTEIGQLIKAGFTCFSNLNSCVSNANQVLANLSVYDSSKLKVMGSDGLLLFLPLNKIDSKILGDSHPFVALLIGDENFANPWYAPVPLQVTGDMPSLAAPVNFDNITSSVAVYMNCKVTLFDGYNYTGGSLPLAASLPGLWNFNDLTSSVKLSCPPSIGTVLDNSGNANDGAVYGATLGVGNGNTGDLLGYKFTPPNSFIDIPSVNKLNPSVITLSAWVNPSSNADGMIISRVSNAYDKQYALSLSGGKPQIAISKNKTWYSVVSNEILPQNTWSFVTGTWDGGTLNIYVNGVLKSTRSQDIPSGGIDTYSTGSTRIGLFYYQAPTYFNGSIDKVRIFERALSEAEVNQLYNARSNTPNQLPFAAFTTNVTLRTANVDASISGDADGTISRYEWLSSDGQMKSGKTASFTFNQTGDYSITLTVTDDKGAVSSAAKNVTIYSHSISNPPTPTTTKPTGPKVLSISNSSDSSITLNWTDDSDNETGFNIYRYNGSNWVKIAAVPENTISYVDSGLQPNSTYYYAVEAYNSLGSNWTTFGAGFISVKTNSNGSPLSPPTGPKKLSKLNISDNSITLNWTDDSNNETGFNVYRHDGSSWVNIAIIPANTTSYVDNGLQPNTTYYYAVEAYNNFGSNWTTFGAGFIAAKTNSNGSPLSPPTGPKKLSKSNISDSSITLNWTDDSNNETGFNVYRHDGSSWVNIAITPANTTSYVDSGLQSNSTYYYAVEAYNSFGSNWTTFGAGFVTAKTSLSFTP